MTRSKIAGAGDALTRRGFVSGAAALVGTSSVTLGNASSGRALAADGPAKGVKAPQWDIVQWLNSDGGNVDTLRGRVIVIDFFQLWCPGCNSFSGPLLKHWQKVFAREISEEKLALVKIHTVFEGHSYQNEKKLRSYVKEKGITMPVGIDRHVAGRHTPVTMSRYRTSGTPEMSFIDKWGMIRFQKFGSFDPDAGQRFVKYLIDETSPTRT